MPLINGRTDFDEQFFSKDTSISRGTNVYTLGENFFAIKTNLEERNVRDITSQLGNFSDFISYDDIVPDSKIELPENIFTEVKLNFDKTELSNYAYFGSLSDKFVYSVTDIVNKFPASIYINYEYNDVMKTIMDYVYDSETKTASFRIPFAAITNNYNIDLTEGINKYEVDTGLRKMYTSFSSYVIWDFENEYKVLGFTGTTLVNNSLYFKVEGNPFGNSTGLVNFHIKPNYQNYVTFLNNLDEFQEYLLNRDVTPKYTATFKVPNLDNDGNSVLVDTPFTWLTTDGYNLDYNTYEFKLYLDGLSSAAKTLDEYKSNIIARSLVSDGVKEFDSDDQRLDKLLKIYGKQFDEIKIYIDGLANMARVTYDKKDNMPDTLVKNFAKSLGWGVFSTVNEKDILNSFLGKESNIVLSGTSKNLTPAEVDIELWRRIVLNSAYLFKSKGTRECIEFLFSIVGAPKSLLDFNEYVYVVEDSLDINNIDTDPDLEIPIDSEGYPKILPNTPNYYFQMKGGWIAKREVAPTNNNNFQSVVGIHIGDYDNGKSYFNRFTDFNGEQGFIINKTIDNKKSWLHDDIEHDSIERATKYVARDRRLVLNSKEASIVMTPTQAITMDVFNYNKQHSYVINPSGLPLPYPDNELTRADVTKMSFLEYVNFIYERFINVKNRKTIINNGNGYPTLKKLYEDYLLANDSMSLTNKKILKFIDELGNFWMDLIEQFIPSTTIWDGGLLYSNTIFDRQKFDYKQGINDGSEFETPFIPSPKFQVSLGQINGSIILPYEGLIKDIGVVNTIYASTLNFPDDGSGGIDNDNKVNILRVKPFLTGDSLDFSQPCLEVEQASKIITGRTEPIIHDIALGNKEIDFNFNCNLNFFNNGGKFKYDIYDFNKSTFEFNRTSIISKTFNSLISTGSTLSINEILTYEFTEGDYLIKPSFRYEIPLTGDTHSSIKEYYAKAASSNISTSPFRLSGDTLIYEVTSLNFDYEYGIYDDENDYWFGIVTSPFIPVVVNDNLIATTITGGTLINTNLPVVENQNEYIINEIPSGDIFLNINGITIKKSINNTFTDGGEYYTTIVGNILKITLNPDIVLNSDDILNVIYVRAVEGSIDSLFLTVNSIPSGTTASSGFLYNTSTNKYEYYTPFVIDVDVEFSEMILVLNGANLSINSDYNKGINGDKIVFNGELSINDTLLIYYNKKEFYLSDKFFTAKWISDNDDNGGLYTVQVSESPLFDTIIISNTTPYIISSTLVSNTYTLYIGEFTTPNKKYYYRVKSEKYHTNMLNEVITTTTFSNVSYFSTK